MDGGAIVLPALIGVILIVTAVCLIYGLRRRETAEACQGTVEKTDNVLVSPVSGLVIPLEQVKDDVFSVGILGNGTAVIPKSGELYAPADGVIANIPESKHAVAMTTDAGAELLMHVGIDTVKLKGEHFTPQVREGEHVKAGQLLLMFALDKIKEAGYDPVTPVVLTNGEAFAITPVTGEVRAGDVLMSLRKKDGQS